MAIVFVTAGRNHQAVRLAQALLDALTVVVIYLTAQRVSRLSSPVVPALLAAMIPFTGIYVRFLLSEVLSIFLTAVLMFFVVHTVRSPRVSSFGAIGLCLGFLILVRPDFALFPLVLISVFIVFWYMNRRLLLTAIALTTIGTGVVLAPWIVRNARAFGGFPSLAAVGGVDGVQPLGFLAWIRTWHGDLVERDQVVWPYWRRDWDRLVLPDAAFSSSSERARVQGIMWRARVARSVAEQRSVDDDFAQLARERTQLHPFRVWISLPARRAVRLWLNSRTEAFPLPSMSNVLNAPFSGVALLKMFLALTNVGLILLAIVGVWAFRHDAVIVTVLAAFVLYRTVFHAYWAGMEPRYVLQAFPAIYILAGEGAGWLVRRFTPFEKRS